MRTRLRRVTQDLHQSVERHFALTGRSWTRQDYRLLLTRLWGFHAPLEAALAALDWRDSGIVLAERRKCAWLEADLGHLGMAADAIARLDRCRDLPRIPDIPAGLGALYVLEGSTLGGQVILRTLEAQLDISPLAGGRFFASHGKAIGAMWRSYLAALETAAAVPANADIVERAALDTFAAFDRWFGQDTVASGQGFMKTPGA